MFLCFCFVVSSFGLILSFVLVSLAKWWGIPAVDGISAVKCRSAVSMPRVDKRKKAAKAVVISSDESHYDDSESSENFFDGVSKYTDSSSDDNMEKLLLKIFKKQIAKKMKKKFISSSSDVFRKHKAKKAKGVVKSDGSFSRFSAKYFRRVSYLDTVDFGERNVPIGFPRMSVWKEGMIKRYSDFDKMDDDTFGLRPPRVICSTSNSQANAHNQFASGAVQNEQQTSPCCNHDVDSYVPLENDLPDNVPLAGNFDNAGDFNCASGYLPSMNTGNASTSVVNDGIAESFGDGQALVTPDVGCAKNFKNSSDERFSASAIATAAAAVKHVAIKFKSRLPQFNGSENVDRAVDMFKPSYKNLFPQDNNSPDLIIVGESKFHDRCNNMTAQSDLIYNASILPTSTAHHASSLGGKIPPHGPRRVLAPAKYTSDPFVQLHRHFPISDVENRYYIAVCRLADSSKWHSYDAVNIDNVKANFYTFGHSLKKSGHVSPSVMAVFCRVMFQNNHPSKSKKNYIFPSNGEQLVVDPSFADAEKVQKSFEGAAKARRLDLCDMLFFPIHYQQHWFLFIVDVKDRMFVFVDSKHEEHSEFYENLKTFVVDNFQNLWNKFVGSSLDFSVFKTVFPPVPRQDYESDSGVFVMKFMEIWSPRILLPNEFSKQNINNIRVKYVNQIFFHAKNKMLHTEIEDAVLNWFNPEKFARQ
ncbi:uncharacterized protein [Oryza sativa Japonica Group]|uniref:uncharacterized protein n=1 Tax=Oryza sativa subsp. japonica TaxID=39947 RepID=UPI00339C1BC6